MFPTYVAVGTIRLVLIWEDQQKQTRLQTKQNRVRWLRQIAALWSCSDLLVRESLQRRERGIEAGNCAFSLKILQKRQREMRDSTTQGDVMEWTCFVSVFPECCNKCCGLTNCLKQKPRGLLQQIKSRSQEQGWEVRITRIDNLDKWIYSTKLEHHFSFLAEVMNSQSLVDFSQVFWFVEISEECLKQQPAYVNCFFEASHYWSCFPFFSCQCADTLL